jgi:hypothetical protein
MPYYDVANLVTVIKTNIIDEMPCGYWNPKNHWCENTTPSLPQSCAVVSAAPKFDYPNSQIS